MTVTAPSSTNFYDGLVPQRPETFTFAVHDASGTELGVLAVASQGLPEVVNQTSQPIRRSIRNLWIPPRPLVDQSTDRYYADDIDPLTMRIKLWHVLGTGDQTQLGEYVWADDSEVIATSGNARPATLVDRSVDLNQQLDTNVSYPAGINVGTALNEQAVFAGFSTVAIEGTTAVLSSPVAWLAGRDTRLRVMEDLCLKAGFLPPYLSNTGLLTCRAAPNLEESTATFAYGLDTRMVAGSIVRSTNRLGAPNRYVAIDTTAVEVPLIGVFDVPASLPHSYESTGRRKIQTVDTPGMTDQASADAAAAAVYAADTRTHYWLSFATPIDPRHDTFDIISFEGRNYLEQGWRAELRAGGQMVHEVYA